MTAAATPPRLPLLAAALGALHAALSLAKPSAFASYDAVAYALDVEHALLTGSSARLWHQYHVLWSPAGWVLAKVLGPLGFHPLLAMQAGTALAGGVLVALVAWLTGRASGSILWGAACGVLAGCWGSTWYYCTNAESYVPALVAALAALALLPLGEGAAPRGRLAASGLALGLAVDLHASLAVLGLPFAVALALTSGGRLPAARRVAAFGLVVALTVLPAYAARSAWGRGVSQSGALVDAVSSVIKTKNAVTPQYFLARTPDPRVELRVLAGSIAFAPEGRPAPQGSRALAWLGAVILALTPAGAVVAWRRRDARALLALGCFPVLLLFFTTYNLGVAKFTPFQAGFAIVGLGLSLGPLARARRAMLLVAVLCAVQPALLNFRRGVVPSADESGNRDIARTLAIRDALRPEDALVLTGAGNDNILKVLVPYFAQREVIVLDFFFNKGVIDASESFSRVRARAERVRARGGRLAAIADLASGGPDALAFDARNGTSSDDAWRALGGRPGAPAAVVSGETVAVWLEP